MSLLEDSGRLPDVGKSLQRLNETYQREQQSYEQFVEGIQSLDPLEKAEAWVEYVADHEDNYGDLEALVYFVSRGRDCTERIRELASEWRLASKRSIEERMRPARLSIVGTGKHGGLVRRGVPYEEASEVLSQSPFTLPNFWFGLDHQDLSIDATMLRTVEWCSIGGFDEWWLRLARENYEIVTQGGVDPIPASFLLFNMCRSDYAIQIMHKSLTRMLEAVEIPEYTQLHPWRRWKWWADPPRAVDHLAYAASLVFTNERLHPGNINAALVDQALEVLLKRQDNEGSWRCWADVEQPSLDTTAMAIHALVLRRPRGWELAVSTARD